MSNRVRHLEAGKAEQISPVGRNDRTYIALFPTADSGLNIQMFPVRAELVEA